MKKNNDNIIEISAVREVVRRAQEVWTSSSSDEYLQSMRRAEMTDERLNRLKSSNVDSVIPHEIILKVAANEYLHTKSVNTALSWLQNYRPFLFLLGSVGRGKTVSTAVILAERTGYYIRAQAAEALFNQKYGTFVDQQNALLEKRLLVIDDLGTERNATEFTATLQRVVDSRQGRKMKTVFTANLTKKQIFERYNDDRLRSRLSQLAIFITDVGDDMRTIKK